MNSEIIKISKIIRSKRRSIALQVCDDATLIVRAPLSVSRIDVENIIFKHHKWLEKKKREMLSRDLQYTRKEFRDGESFLYLGRAYPLKVVKPYEKEDYLTFKDEIFYLRKDAVSPIELFYSWYKREANKKIFERVIWYAHKSGFQFNKIKISNARKRWGSCSHLGNLNFSWRLIMAPEPVIDYVTVHELVHLVDKSHSRSFWKRVSRILPDYKKHRIWLKKKGYLLDISLS